MEQTQPDSVVQAVINSFRERSELGKKKYGTTLDRKDLGVKDWIQHTQEELMDAVLYLEKLKQDIAPTSQHHHNHSVKIRKSWWG
jgi:hypothetical protein